MIDRQIPPDEKATQTTARYEILPAVTVNITVIWDVISCSVVEKTQKLISKGFACRLLLAGCLLGSLFGPENGDCANHQRRNSRPLPPFLAAACITRTPRRTFPQPSADALSAYLLMAV
jgi:hypothetical protein